MKKIFLLMLYAVSLVSIFSCRKSNECLPKNPSKEEIRDYLRGTWEPVDIVYYNHNDVSTVVGNEIPTTCGMNDRFEFTEGELIRSNTLTDSCQNRFWGSYGKCNYFPYPPSSYHDLITHPINKLATISLVRNGLAYEWHIRSKDGYFEVLNYSTFDNFVCWTARRFRRI